ncbi:MAG: cytochrome c oxidase subunit II [Robiginitomaculum sp.]|nr:MAG: cytochrome c oxidase subunit II [Robiginitomaculum sp.]
MRISRLAVSAGATLAGLATSSLAFASNKNGPTDGDIGFQRSVTPVMDAITSFNNYWLVPIMIAIVVFVTVLMIYIMVRFREKANPVPSKTTHHVGLEVAWTLIPVVILAILAYPSMKLLYFQDVIPESELVVKVTGDTWNWEYSYPDHENIDPYVSSIVDIATADKFGLSHAQIIAKIDARPADEPRLDGRPYLFASDAPLVVPVDTVVKVLVTSNNNIHAFAVPQFGVKIDAVPGRINETWFKVHAGEEGTYYGQCSEICGINHAFMPIEVMVVSKDEFKRWAANGGSFAVQISQNTGSGALAISSNTVQ